MILNKRPVRPFLKLAFVQNKNLNNFQFENIFDFWQKHYQEAEAEAIRASAALAGVQDHQEGLIRCLWNSDLSLDSVLLSFHSGQNFWNSSNILRQNWSLLWYGVLCQVSTLLLAKDWEL